MKIAIKLFIPKKQDGLKKWSRRPPWHGPTLGCAMEGPSGPVAHLNLFFPE
jgi:hypothetical protein